MGLTSLTSPLPVALTSASTRASPWETPQGAPSLRQQQQLPLQRKLSISASAESARSSRSTQAGRSQQQGNPAPLRQEEDAGASAGATWQKRLPEAVSGVLRIAAAAAVGGIITFSSVEPSSARLEGVNKPELLPQEFTRVIDTGGFLSTGQIRRLADDIARLEQDTGYKLRVLSQSYPNTPGLAIREYWGVDDDTIVFVADPTFRNILNFNVGATVDLKVPRSFWTRLAGKYGNQFYWKEQGEDAAIEAAVLAIDACLREEPGPRQCADIK